ncbi:Serine protease 23 [Larimichthys crocea]|uniref:Uncharacterized protein n=1 Tax=Larimichthys crocea TaxID=215358 RepID=A0ACD3RCK8_LARCR|nr:Serine protease 23 [Larimichthys crocea]
MMPRESSVLTHLLLHLLLPHTLSFLQPPHHPPPVHIPTLVPHVPTPLIRSRFSAHTQLDLTTHCNSSCFHRGEQEVQKEELTEKLAFETLYSDGSRTLTTVDVEGDKEFEGDAGAPRRKPRVKSRHKRVRRQIYGADGRFNIQGDNFLLDYPFSTACADLHRLHRRSCVPAARPHSRPLRPRWEGLCQGCSEAQGGLPDSSIL